MSNFGIKGKILNRASKIYIIIQNEFLGHSWSKIKKFFLYEKIFELQTGWNVRFRKETQGNRR